MLKFSPTQIKAYRNIEFPKGLIYEHRDKSAYSLMDTCSGNFVGEMSIILRACDNLPFYETEPNASTLHVYSLRVYDQCKGWGTYLIEFAKKQSYKRGCEGRCSLVAHHSGRSPHPFYKKLGFVTMDQGYNDFLDMCVATGRRLYYENAKNMFIPIPKFAPKPKPLEIPKEKSFWQKVKDYFKPVWLK